MSAQFDVSAMRKHFPALQHKQIYFDNAGGSQVLQEVITSVSDYLSSNNVQLGASYPVAQESTRLFQVGCEAVAKYINALPEEVVIGPSTTQLFRNVSQALFNYVSPGDEIIVSKLDHEANIASWIQLAADRGCTLKWYAPELDKQNPHVELPTLRKLLSPRTKLVAFTHTSNILGTINDVKAIAQAVHEVGALLVVDAVAYAPHRQVDVKELEVDIYSFSWYKVYGPHVANLYVSKAAQKHLRTLGHFFHPVNQLSYTLGLAAANYELTASIPHVVEYLKRIPWDQIADHEERLQGILIDYLNSKAGRIKICGEPVADKHKRVPVISFVVEGRSSREVVEAVEAKSNYGFRWGSFYSNRLVQDVLGLDPVDGVIRVSLVHYNTEEEIRGFVKVLDEVLSS